MVEPCRQSGFPGVRLNTSIPDDWETLLWIRVLRDGGA